MQKPNILIFLGEQHRADCLSCAGHSIVRTPHLDALAAGGVRFSCAYTTSPVCMPARSTIQSGLYPHNLRQWSNHDCLDPCFDNMARNLKALGYRTAYIGKSHLYVARMGGHLEEHRHQQVDDLQDRQRSETERYHRDKEDKEVPVLCL